MRLVWGALGFVWGALGLVWGALGLVWGALGLVWGALGLVWGALGPRRYPQEHQKRPKGVTRSSNPPATGRAEAVEGVGGG